MSAGKIFPLNLFGIAFGLSGLAGTWTAAGEKLHFDAAVGNAFWILAAAVWAVSVTRYLLGARTWRQVLEDLGHPVLGPFAALVPASGMLFGGRLSHYAPTAGKTLVLIMFVLTIAIATLFVRHLMLGGLDFDKLHPGYLLPTVAAGLIGGQSLATVGLHSVGIASFAVGILMWLLLGAALTARLAFRPSLPSALIPTIAIFAAPPAVGGNAWFALSGRLDLFQHALLGTFVLLILVQLALVPTYAKLPFGLGFWALTFTTAASGTYGIHWLTASGLALGGLWTILILAAVTLLIGWIAVRSILLVAASHHKTTLEPVAAS
jgi:tellurite resistance protein